VGLLLELLVEGFPLLLQSSDELLAFILRHEELCTISLVLFLDLHFADQVILVLDFVLDLGHVIGDSAVALLLEIVLLGVLGKFGGGKDILNSVCNDKVFIADKAMNWLVIMLGDSGLRLSRTVILGN
jgi:hypothetical protein